MTFDVEDRWTYFGTTESDWCVPLGCRPRRPSGRRKWGQEVRPSRRLTAREQFLPWAVPSFPARCRRVNHLDPHPALGLSPLASLLPSLSAQRVPTLVPAPQAPRHATEARPAKTPHDAGAAGWPVNATGPPPTVNNAAETR